MSATSHTPGGGGLCVCLPGTSCQEGTYFNVQDSCWWVVVVRLRWSGLWLKWLACVLPWPDLSSAHLKSHLARPLSCDLKAYSTQCIFKPPDSFRMGRDAEFCLKSILVAISKWKDTVIPPLSRDGFQGTMHSRLQQRAEVLEVAECWVVRCLCRDSYGYTGEERPDWLVSD